MKIVWSRFALKDLDSIYDFIALDSANYAKKLVDKIIQRVGALKDFPESGRMVPEFDNQLIRELIEGNYRIVYYMAEKLVTIIRIHHSSRKLEA